MTSPELGDRDRTRIITYRSLRIVYDDWSFLRTRAEMLAAMERSLVVLQKQEVGNTYAITDVTECYYDKELLGWLQNVATPISRIFVVANAVIGLSPLQGFILKKVMQFSKRPFYVAKTVEEAKELLYQHELKRREQQLNDLRTA